MGGGRTATHSEPSAVVDVVIGDDGDVELVHTKSGTAHATDPSGLRGGMSHGGSGSIRVRPERFARL